MGFDHVKMEKGMYRESARRLRRFSNRSTRAKTTRARRSRARTPSSASSSDLISTQRVRTRTRWKNSSARWTRASCSRSILRAQSNRAWRKTMCCRRLRQARRPSMRWITEAFIRFPPSRTRCSCGIRGREHSGNPGQDEGKPCQAQQARQNARRVL